MFSLLSDDREELEKRVSDILNGNDDEFSSLVTTKSRSTESNDGVPVCSCQSILFANSKLLFCKHFLLLGVFFSMLLYDMSFLPSCVYLPARDIQSLPRAINHFCSLSYLMTNFHCFIVFVLYKIKYCPVFWGRIAVVFLNSLMAK